jgi:hypothetical protein
MNSRDYYTRQYEPWDDTEYTQLRDEYENQKLTISEIGDLHKRTPGCFSNKLIELNIIKQRVDARGYIEYTQSALYKDLITNGHIQNNTDKPIKKPDRVGKKWMKEEEQQLLDELQNNMSFHDIATIHERTVCGIKAHCETIIYQMYQNGHSNEEISKTIMFSDDDIRYIINKYELKKENHKERCEKRNKEHQTTIPTMIEPRSSKYELELTELRQEMTSIKNDVKEILRLMNALYEFENQ